LMRWRQMQVSLGGAQEGGMTMQARILTWASVIALMASAATPALAQPSWLNGLFGPAPSFAYQNPDGSYPSYTDFSEALSGMPCGIECQAKARARWGLPPPPPPPPVPPPYYYHYPAR